MNNEEPKNNLINPLVFNPQELDFSVLRELPEVNIAAVTAIPAEVLKSGYDQTKPME